MIDYNLDIYQLFIELVINQLEYSTYFVSCINYII